MTEFALFALTHPAQPPYNSMAGDIQIRHAKQIGEF